MIDLVGGKLLLCYNSHMKKGKMTVTIYAAGVACVERWKWGKMGVHLN